MERKKICYFIFAIGAAKGGHYRSLATIAEESAKYNDCVIVNLGYTHASPIQNSAVKSHFVYFNGWNLFQALKSVTKLVDMSTVDCFHTFDSVSFLVARKLAQSYKIPVVTTKCGGPVPKKYFPKAPYITLFSEEDFEYFINTNKFKNAKIELIPNRVSPFCPDQAKIDYLKNKYSLQDKIVFLRITRIAKYYKKSITQSINLVRKLQDHFPNVALLVVGHNQHPEELLELEKENAGCNIFFETEESIIADAKRIIDVADYVIGTGRGFMEASSKGKILLSPSQNGDYPVLINESNFKVAFSRNFSERIEFNQVILDNNFQEIISLLDTPQKSLYFRKLSMQRYERYFSIEKGIEKYNKLYQIATYKDDLKIDILRNWIFAIRQNLGTWYRNAKKML